MRSFWEKSGFEFERRDGATYLFVDKGKTVNLQNSLIDGQSITLRATYQCADGIESGVAQ
jgi:hypothetical protein